MIRLRSGAEIPDPSHTTQGSEHVAYHYDFPDAVHIDVGKDEKIIRVWMEDFKPNGMGRRRA